MAVMQVVPGELASAAQDVGRIGAALEGASAFAALRTSSVLPAGADEVSAAITPLFLHQSRIYRELAAEADAFEQRFRQLLAAAGVAYIETDQAAQQALRDAVGELESPLIPLATQAENPAPTNIPPLMVPQNGSVALIVGGTTFPLPDAKYAGSIMANFLNNPTLSPLTGALGQPLYTPEQFWPFTPQLGNLTLGQSVAHGVQLLNTAVNTELAAGNNVIVYGTSQSSLVATNEIRNLMAVANPPDPGKLSFVLTGDPGNPNGGFFERFPGLYIPLFDVLMNGATPPDSPYPTVIFTNQYDMVTNLPQYVLNPVSDLNAFMGFALYHGTHDYVDLTPGQIANAIQLPTSPGYTGSTRYYELLTQNLPLVSPLRLYVPAPYGNALADLLQPDLRVIVDMGYGSGEYADIPTPASLFELPNPFTIVPDLAHGAVQGPQAALVDLGLLPQSMMPTGYPFDPALDPGLNFPLPQSPVTGVSLLTGFEGRLMRALGLIPSWDS
ncbi:PE family protein [Mycobacterium interjectum]|uniref:PE family protein n=2 Tax=Mycobacterium interjectum TaxID=33895 RepID=UPI000A034494|nr:PE-PPE domain-containing protein [Mycobacterium interjectum]MCV7092778.1 PE-PPE domain-containing protein [Mycobacterium interjectum]